MRIILLGIEVDMKNLFQAIREVIHLGAPEVANRFRDRQASFIEKYQAVIDIVNQWKVPGTDYVRIPEEGPHSLYALIVELQNATSAINRKDSFAPVLLDVLEPLIEDFKKILFSRPTTEQPKLYQLKVELTDSTSSSDKKKYFQNLLETNSVSEHTIYIYASTKSREIEYLLKGPFGEIIQDKINLSEKPNIANTSDEDFTKNFNALVFRRMQKAGDHSFLEEKSHSNIKRSQIYYNAEKHFHATLMMLYEHGNDYRLSRGGGICFGILMDISHHILVNHTILGRDIYSDPLFKPIFYLPDSGKTQREGAMLKKNFFDLNNLFALSQRASDFQESREVNGLINRFDKFETEHFSLIDTCNAKKITTIDDDFISRFVAFSAHHQNQLACISFVSQTRKTHHGESIGHIVGLVTDTSHPPDKFYFFVDANSGVYRFSNIEDVKKWIPYYCDSMRYSEKFSHYYLKCFTFDLSRKETLVPFRDTPEKSEVKTPLLTRWRMRRADTEAAASSAASFIPEEVPITVAKRTEQQTVDDSQIGQVSDNPLDEKSDQSNPSGIKRRNSI